MEDYVSPNFDEKLVENEYPWSMNIPLQNGVFWKRLQQNGGVCPQLTWIFRAL